MRVLYITPYVPSRIRVRPYNLIKSLSERHEVTLVSLVQSDYDRHALAEMSEVCASVKTVKMSKMQSVVSCGRRLFSKMPLQAAYTYFPDLTRAVDELLAKKPFDVVHVEHIRGAHYATHIGSVPKVYDSVDCITLLLRQFLSTKKNPIAWFLALEEWAKMRTYEAMVTEQFDRVIITSPHDQNAIEQLVWDRARKMLKSVDVPGRRPTTPDEIEDWRVTKQLIELSQDQRLAKLMPQDNRVSVVPNGVDHGYFQPMDMEEDPDNIVFSGKMSYYANVNAIKHFYDNIFPIIRSVRPQTRLTIVGAEPPAAIQRLASDPAVTVTGYVDDIRPYLAKSALAICPITVAVGIQNKVLEAMSMGKPVVATSRVCGAIAAKNGRDFIQADKPEDFASAVVDLLTSPQKRREIGANAARYVRDRHDWSSIAGRLEDVYLEASEVFKTRRALIGL